MQNKLVRNIIFTKTPLKSKYRYKDKFQIYPCTSSEAPKSEVCDDFPIYIEFLLDSKEKIAIGNQFKEIEEIMISTSRQENARNRITRLLSVVTNHRFFNYNHEGLKWGIPFPDLSEDEQEINSKSSQPIIGIYTYPSMSEDLSIHEFDESPFPEINLKNHKSYYFYDPIENKKGEILFPQKNTDILDAYYRLDAKKQKKVDTICHIICNGIDLEKSMKSLSFLSFISAIETLISIESIDSSQVEIDCNTCNSIKSSPIECSDCGAPVWGIKVKFKEFLRKYVATSEEAEKKFNKIYNLRSKIIHSGSLLLGDEQYDWSQSEALDSHWIIHLETKQLARLALVNWLLMRNNLAAPPLR